MNPNILIPATPEVLDAPRVKQQIPDLEPPTPPSSPPGPSEPILSEVLGLNAPVPVSPVFFFEQKIGDLETPTPPSSLPGPSEPTLSEVLGLNAPVSISPAPFSEQKIGDVEGEPSSPSEQNRSEVKADSEESLSGISKLDCTYFRGNTFIPQSHQHHAKTIYQKLEKDQRGILLYHKFGSGKTCTSILIADYLLNEPNNLLNRVYVLTPGNLRRNFHHEYCFVCGTYVADFKNNYTFISYNYGQLKTSDIQFPNFNNSIVIIDEIHNLIKAYINAAQNENSVAKAIINKLNTANNVKIIALSGDPIYSKPEEAGYIFELLKPSLNRDEVNSLLSNPEAFKRTIQNLVSYIPGKDRDFPQIVDHIVECEMSEVQKSAFFPIQEIENKLRKYKLRPVRTPEDRKLNSYIITAKLYIRTRRASNFYYPPWAGINATKDPEEESSEQLGTSLENEDVRAELGTPVEPSVQEEDMSNEQKSVLDQYVPVPIGKRLYIVVAKDGAEMAESEVGNSPIIKHLFQGDTFFKLGIHHNRHLTNGNVKWKVESGDATGYITLPKEKLDRNKIAISAQMIRPDKCVPKGWVNTKDFEGVLGMYSRKFLAVLQKISNNFSGKHALFSFFKTRGGLRLMGAFLENCGISYRLYTGDENDEEKTQILTEYNSPQNIDGDRIKIILFSFAGSEGMTLTAVQHLHILETDLREGRARQVIGRTARYKSHHMLHPDKQKVNVWRYWSVTSSDPEVDKGVDRELYTQAQLRYEAIQQVLTYFEEASIERVVEGDQKDDAPLDAIIPIAPDIFKNNREETIRSALNQLLYWNYHLLDPTSETGSKIKDQDYDIKSRFEETLVFDPGYIYQINTNNTLTKFHPSRYSKEKRLSYIKFKKMSQPRANQAINILQTIQDQNETSELMRLFPIILEENKKITRFYNSLKK